MKNSKILKIVLGTSILVLPFFINSCKSVKVPTGLSVVENFDVKSYSGKWYEIARFDFKHEKDMDQVTAEYSINDDGSIKVLNKGYNTKKNEWKESEGKAKFVSSPDQGALKVSFFGPFYSGYNIVAMEPNYKNALIFGENKDYIWLLSREKKMPESVKEKFLKIARDYGYDLNRLVWTKQE
ncbi:lipocalin family protein [Sphingobacterium bovistauri]|uniref:Lipocalin family protein n=1 Tax=Sphingobacterium bovistauri TaxID=2781959 RepID=A0ABS7Z9N8_9SPHI|nr:lipocalin family protein [Sphingobacterium bovistauri]MCA5006302.1 lipocalin family protein [Sphingobacterium bovistauri]